MVSLRVHRLFVIDRDGVLVGIIATSDVLQRLAA
jgi:predicted transcriptional regulator